jgi:hypothetical protein
MDFNTFMVSADEILPGLWLGNEATSQSPDFMHQNKIKLVVNASKDIPSKFLDRDLNHGKIYYIRVPVDDPGIGGVKFGQKNKDVSVMRKSLPLVLQVILKARQKGWNVLVHCHAGAQRSAIIVASYLLTRGYAMTPDDAITQVIRKRSIAFFGGSSVNFKAIFDDLARS